jgi:transcription elongation factor GreB
MSKAFTRESDDAEEMPVFRQAVPAGVTNYITSEGAERLRARLENLITRKQAYVKEEQRKLESEIRNLQLTLNSVVVAKLPADRGKVAFGATVSVRHVNGGEETYRIVGIEEASPEKGEISWLSPLARALMSRRVGERARFRSPAGDEELEILNIGYEIAGYP